MNGQLVGGLVQAYAYTRWHEPSKTFEIECLGQRLEPNLRKRVDALGAQAKRLLTVDCADVLMELEALEGEEATEPG